MRTLPCSGLLWYFRRCKRCAAARHADSTLRFGLSRTDETLRNCANTQKVVHPQKAPPHPPKTAQLTSCYPIRLHGHSLRYIRVRLFRCHGPPRRAESRLITRKQFVVGKSSQEFRNSPSTLQLIYKRPLN